MARLLVEECRYLGSCGVLRLQEPDLNSQRNGQLAHPIERLLRLIGLEKIDERGPCKGEADQDDSGVGDDELGPKAARDYRRPPS
jgi:hypothetical protein